MQKPRRNRHDARRVALQALYMLDQNPATSPEQIREFVHHELQFPKLEVFCRELIDGVRENRQEIDASISKVSQNWEIGRMPAVDRSILRLAGYELMYRPEVPPRVAINEALEICKAFSTADSVAFVNGILDKIASKGE